MYDYCCLGAYVIVVVLVQRVVVLSWYCVLVFVVVVRPLFVFEQFRRAKYILSDIRNQINGL